MVSLLGLRSDTASFKATNEDWSLATPDPDLPACTLADCRPVTDDTRPVSRLVVVLPASGPSARSRRDAWPPPALDVLDVTADSGDADVDLTMLSLPGFSACFICACRCCGRAIRSGGMLSVVVELDWRAPVSDVDVRGRSDGELAGNDHGDVRVCDLVTRPLGR